MRCFESLRVDVGSVMLDDEIAIRILVGFATKFCFNGDSKSDCSRAILRNRRWLKKDHNIIITNTTSNGQFTLFQQMEHHLFEESHLTIIHPINQCFETLPQFRLNLVSNSIKCFSFRFFSISQNLRQTLFETIINISKRSPRPIIVSPRSSVAKHIKLLPSRHIVGRNRNADRFYLKSHKALIDGRPPQLYLL